MAAATVVTANVKPLAIVGNQPMKTIQYRDREHYEELSHKQEIQTEISVNYDTIMVKRLA